MSIIQGTAKATAGDDSFYPFEIGQSLRFDGSSYLTKTFTLGNRTTWTYSSWIKRSTLSSTAGEVLLFAGTVGSTDYYLYLSGTTDTLQWYDRSSGSNVVSANQFRDTSGWYHFVVILETSASPTLKFYVNGNLVTEFSTSTYPATSSSQGINTATVHRIGNRNWTTDDMYFNGYMAEINFIDGYKTGTTVATHDDFGEQNNGVWVPKEYKPSGSSNQYGTNGFRLSFALSDFNTSGSAVTDPHGSSTNVPDGYVADASGSGNHWNVN